MAVTNRLGAVLLASILAAAAMVLVLVGPGAKPAKTQVQTPPPTLTGESLQADSCRSVVDPTPACVSNDELPGEVTVTSSIDAIECNVSASGGDEISYEASGQATGPYPGTFTESGTFTLDSERNITSFEATFTIDSPIGKVTGTKQSTQGFSGSLSCLSLLGLHVLILSSPEGQVSYEATIVTPTSGTYIDRGTATGSASDSTLVPVNEAGLLTARSVPGEGLLGELYGDGQLESFGETFTSDLSQVERVIPTTKEQCKKGGWKDFGYPDQGTCITAFNENRR
jgi:hypothetical protein